MGLCCSNDYSVIVHDAEFIAIYDVNKAKQNSKPSKETQDRYQKILRTKIDIINNMIDKVSNDYKTSVQINSNTLTKFTLCDNCTMDGMSDDTTNECEIHCKITKYYQNKIIQDIIRIYDRNGYHAFKSTIGIVHITWA